jgi:hypothetical protein
LASCKEEEEEEEMAKKKKIKEHGVLGVNLFGRV